MRENLNGKHRTIHNHSLMHECCVLGNCTLFQLNFALDPHCAWMCGSGTMVADRNQLNVREPAHENIPHAQKCVDGVKMCHPQIFVVRVLGHGAYTDKSVCRNF